MSAYSRPVLLLLAGLLLLTISIALLNTLVPLWLSHASLPTWQVGLVSSSYFTGNLAGTLLTGVLIKRFGFTRSYHMACLMAPALFVLGCSGFTLYPVAMSWACEKVSPDELVAMNQALLLSYTLGSLFGPSMTAMLMQRYSDHLLFVMIAAVALVYLVMLLRKPDRHHTPVATA
ncbi:MAG: hypothetical protein ACMX3H_05805 [Sodalis sp. (in: enterobacteria)]|uniref:hypothetical protein n=1 Tax=Sodalis sp. (in: enterobacteria) TaxID=1898979 RepID=UPI0039E4CC16